MGTRAAAAVDADEQRFRDAEWEALPMWRRGEVVPARLTLYLDARGLYGPQVDIACGVREPAVDEWEAGKRYPRFPELIALARLVDVPATAFFGRLEPVHAIFMCGGSRRKGVVIKPARPINAYPEPVWRPVVEGLTDTLFELPNPNGAMQ